MLVLRRLQGPITKHRKYCSQTTSTALVLSSDFQAVGDAMNRSRHYFWFVDSSGRLWRKQWDKPTETQGQIRETAFLDNFLGKLTPNKSGLYDSQYPFLCMRGNEHNFVQAKVSPIVFTDLRDNKLFFGSLSVPFDPKLLSIQDDKELRIYHEVSLPLTPPPKSTPENTNTYKMPALIQRSLADKLVDNVEIGPNDNIIFWWEGEAYPLPKTSQLPQVPQDLLPRDTYFVPINTKWWNEEQ